MKIEVEMTEDGGFIVRNAQGKLWVAREYSLLMRIREAFGLQKVEKHNKRPKKEQTLPSESYPEEKKEKTSVHRIKVRK